MDAIKVAYRQGAGRMKMGMSVAAKDFHATIIVLIADAVG
jgi:hypothetical protein